MKQTVCDFQLQTAEWSQHGSSSAPAIAMWESVIHSHLFCRLRFAAVGHFMHLTCSLHKKLSIHKNVDWIRLQCKLNPAHAVCIMMYIIRCTLLSEVIDARTEQNLLNMLWILQHWESWVEWVNCWGPRGCNYLCVNGWAWPSCECWNSCCRAWERCRPGSLSLSLWSVSASEQPLLNRIMDRFLTFGYNLQNPFLRLQSGDEDEDDDV